MTAPYYAQKKRPPPIEIPVPYPQRPIVPGPNAFAIAERAAQEEQRRLENIDQEQPAFHSKTSGRDGAVHVVADGSPSRLPRSQSTVPKLPMNEKSSNIVDQQESEYSQNASSIASRHGSTTRSRHSERSHNSLASTQRRLEGLSEDSTARAVIEAQKERKLFKLMGQVPETPTDGTAPLSDYVSVQDMRPSRTSGMSKQSDREISTRSPKKKIFGVSIPFSRAVMGPIDTPPMPLKAAKLMGATPVKTRKFSPLAKMAAGISVPRSDTSKSLPSKLFNQPARHCRRRSPTQVSPRGRTSRRSPPAKSPTKATMFSHVPTLEALTGPQDVEMPPIPPRKDSLPPELRQRFPDLDKKVEALKAEKAANAPRTVSQLLRPPTPKMEPDDFKDGGMKLSFPSDLLPSIGGLDPIPPPSGQSPSKYCPPYVAERAKFVEGEPLFSAHGTLEYAIEEEVGDEEEEQLAYSAPLESPNKAPVASWSAKRQSAPATPITATTAWLHRVQPPKPDAPAPKDPSPKLEYLLPTVYSQPKIKARKIDTQQVENSLQRKERPRSDSVPPSSGSIPIIFQGDVDEIDPQSATARSSPYIATKAPVPPQSIDDVGSRNFAPRFMEELRIKPPVNGPTKVSEQGGLQPEQSSSQLTDMLNGVSPSRADFRGYDSSSAVPSPLLRNPQSSMVPQQPDARAPEPDAGQAPSVFPAMPLPPRPRPGVPMHDHFFMTNEHIDVVAMSIFDWVKGCNDQTVKVAAFKNEQLKATIEKRFDDIKSQINSVGEKADHNGNQGHNVGVQLDKLRDFIKSEVVDVLALQAQKLKGVEKGIKELQKEMQDLQKSVAQSQTSTSTYPSPHQAPNFVNSRSQPSLPAFYDPNISANGDIATMPTGPPVYGRYGSNMQAGRAAFGRDNREGRENSSFAFSSTGNPYHSPGASFNNVYGTGGYQQPLNGYSSMHEQQPYGYNQGLQK